MGRYEPHPWARPLVVVAAWFGGGAGRRQFLMFTWIVHAPVAVLPRYSATVSR